MTGGGVVGGVSGLVGGDGPVGLAGPVGVEGVEGVAGSLGVAGPGGGSPAKPVGLVYLHVETPDASRGERFELPGDRARVRGRAAAFVLHELRRVLSAPVHEAR